MELGDGDGPLIDKKITCPPEADANTLGIGRLVIFRRNIWQEGICTDCMFAFDLLFSQRNPSATKEQVHSVAIDWYRFQIEGV